MNKILFFLLTISVLSCQTGPGSEAKSPEHKDSNIVRLVAGEPEANVDTIILYENRMQNIPLPFPRREMLNELRSAFKGMDVTKEIGQQDGPDFPLYSVKRKADELCFFAMNWEDKLKLDELYVKSPVIKDQYGLKVGDGYRKLKRLRGSKLSTFTNLHQHTFAYFEGSNIMYEISGDVFIPDTVDLENLKFTEDQIKDWTIEYVIWRK